LTVEDIVAELEALASKEGPATRERILGERWWNDTLVMFSLKYVVPALLHSVSFISSTKTNSLAIYDSRERLGSRLGKVAILETMISSATTQQITSDAPASARRLRLLLAFQKKIVGKTFVVFPLNMCALSSWLAAS